MLRDILKKSCFFLGVFMTLFFVRNANAYIVSQPTLGSTYDFGGTTGTLWQTFTSPVNGRWQSMKVPISRVSGSGTTCNMTIYPKGVNNGGNGSGNTIVVGGDQSSQANWTTFNFNTSSANYNVVAGSQYGVFYSCGAGSFWRAYGATSNVYSGGQMGTSTDFAATLTTPPGSSSIYDSGFIVTFYVTSTQVDFTDTPTSTCQFENWKISPSISATDSATCLASHTCSMGVAMNVNYSGTTTYVYNVNDGGDDIFADPTYIVNSFPLTNGNVYSARTYICSKSSIDDCQLGVGTNANLMAVSANWQFIVNGLDTCTSTYFSQNEIPPPGVASTTVINSISAQASAACLSYSDGTVLGGIVYGICKVLVALFVPSDSVLSNFTQLRTMVSTKPPFGYYTVYSSAIDDLQNSTSTSSTIATSSPQFISFLSAYTSGYAWYSTYLTVIRAVLWIAFGFSVYAFFKKFTPNS